MLDLTIRYKQIIFIKAVFEREYRRSKFEVPQT